MLGKYVRICVTNPIHSVDESKDFAYQLNFGLVEGLKIFNTPVEGAYIMGVNHPVKNFNGRIIGIIRRKGSNAVLLITAPKNMHFIDNQIIDAVSFAIVQSEYTLECLYEKSCGAIVYRVINDKVRFLLIKNKKSAHWGFPKGHIEKGETSRQTALREVLEEVGLEIEIIPEFESKSEYTVQSRVEKSVTIFLAKTSQTTTTIQPEEIGDYAWLDYDKAIKTLRFENDKVILKQANDFLKQHKTEN
jgi:8-oxo-dGTP pyrophosphatase MutT (NUDIX family)